MTIKVEFGSGWIRKNDPNFIYLISSQGDIRIWSDFIESVSIKLLVVSCSNGKEVQINIHDQKHYSGFIKSDQFKKINLNLVLNGGWSFLQVIIMENTSKENSSINSEYQIGMKDFLITRFETIRVI